jgi:hypothetical protein
MNYKDYMNVIVNLPKIWPTVDIGVNCVDWENDNWLAYVSSEGEDGYGNYVTMSEYGITTPKRLEQVILRFSDFSRRHIVIPEQE